jgi:hypothetical protein
LLNENFTHHNDPLQVIESSKKKEFVIRNLNEVIVESFSECMELLKLGEQNRSYAVTKMNHQSSRSHTIYRLSVESMSKPAGIMDAGGSSGFLGGSPDDKKSSASGFSADQPMYGATAALNFVDLAGSERASVHD